MNPPQTKNQLKPSKRLPLTPPAQHPHPQAPPATPKPHPLPISHSQLTIIPPLHTPPNKPFPPLLTPTQKICIIPYPYPIPYPLTPYPHPKPKPPKVTLNIKTIYPHFAITNQAISTTPIGP